MSSERTCGSTPFEEMPEFGTLDSYLLDEKMRDTPHFHHLVDVHCVACGVNVGFGHCFHCLEIAVKVCRYEDELDEL